MNSLLLISYSCGVQKIRTANILSNEFGFEITILTNNVPDSFEGELSSEINVHYVNDKLQVSLYRPYWTYYATRKAHKLIVDNDVDTLLSWHVPIASHLVALRMKQKHDISWLAHFGDPWIGNPYAGGVFRKLIYSKHLEKSILRNAGAVTFPTERMKNMYQNRYPEFTTKLHIVPNFIDPSELEKIDSEPDKFSEQKMSMVHTGSFYGIRSPEPLFKAIDMLDKNVRENIEIHLIGDLGNFNDVVDTRELTDVIEKPGLISKTKALKFALFSDVLILIDAPLDDSPFLPTKLAEYLFMENPILGITPEEGTSADVILKTGMGTVVSPEKPSKIAENIEEYYKAYLEDNLFVNPNWEEINQYSSDAAVSDFASIISGLN